VGEWRRGDPDDQQQGTGTRPHNNENPWQGSYVVDTLADLVEEAVY
jgi:hypothetical protein